MESGNVFNLQDFEQNEVPFKQRSFEDSIDTIFSLFDADLLLIWMNNFRHGFRFRSASCPVLHIVLIISRGECSITYNTSTHLSCLVSSILVLYIRSLITSITSLTSSAIPSSSVFVESRSVISEAPLFALPQLRPLYALLLPVVCFLLLLLFVSFFS